jgi:hypothetical protein
VLSFMSDNMWGSGGKAPCIFVIGISLRWVVSSLSSYFVTAPNTHWIWSWMSCRTGLNAMVMREISDYARNWILAIHPVAYLSADWNLLMGIHILFFLFQYLMQITNDRDTEVLCTSFSFF